MSKKYLQICIHSCECIEICKCIDKSEHANSFATVMASVEWWNLFVFFGHFCMQRLLDLHSETLLSLFFFLQILKH